MPPKSTAASKASKKQQSSSESDASSASATSSGSEDERSTKKKAAAPVKKPAAAAGKKKAASSSDSSSGTSSSESDSDEGGEFTKAAPKKKATAAKKPAPKKKTAASSSSESDTDDDDEKPKAKKPAVKAAAPPTKKPAAAAKKPNAFAGLDDDEEDESESESEDGSSADSESEETKPAAKGKKPAAAAAAATEKPAAAAKGKKKGEKKAADVDADLDSILQDLAITPKAGGAAAAAAAATTEDGKVDESKLTKAQLKRLRQKEKQAEEAKAAAAGGGAAAAAPADAAAAAAPKKDAPKKEEAKKDDAKKPAPKAGNKAVEALKEKLRLQKEAEEARIKAEQERIAKEEAEAARLAEEEKRAAEEKERRHQERLKKREADRAAGLLLTKTEKAAQAKREAFLKQLAASGQPLPPALQAKVAPGTAADGETVTEEAAPKEKSSKKDQHKKKSAFGKRMEAQKEAERIRAERHANEDASRAAAKAEDERRKKEDAEAEATHAKQLAELDAEEAALDEPEPVEEEAKSDAEGEEEVAESWEDVDSEEDRRKATEKEERRAAKIAEKVARAKAKDAKRIALAKKREELQRTREAQLAELRKQRQAYDEQRKKAAEEARKAQEEAERQAKAVEGGFELAKETITETDSTSTSGKANKHKGDLRSPIVCILGHVDTGKTKILDNIRQTSVQKGEAGGITQQIGATFMPRANIIQKTAELNKFIGKELRMETPGLLVIDTPGHESFTNLRSRGNNLADIAILVIDIMAGLEKQTIESINLLKQRKTPFVIALNKIDRCYGWKTQPNAPFQVTLAAQNDNVKAEFEKRKNEAILLMAQQGLNCVPYYENTDFRKNISVVPTSAITGEGIPDLLMLLVQLTQNMMNERLSYLSELQCTVLEVKVVEGLGTTIDVILVNGTLREGDTIVVCGLTGPIVTTIRALLTPPPMQEIRVKSDYVHHKMVHAAMGVKISAQGLESAVAGSSLLVCKKNDDVEELKDEVQGDLATILSKVDKSGQGVAVQASTLGSLEALLTFLAEMKIPVSSISIGPVFKKDVMKAAVMLEKRPEFAVMLCFDVKVSPDAAKLADEMGVKIFTADIIYHLFDNCVKWMDEVKEKKRVESAETAVFPVVLDILPNAVFNVKSPIVLGVKVIEGVARIGTPLCIPSKQFLFIGRITGIQKNHVDFQEAKKGESFACKIEQSKSDQQIVFGRQFDASSQLVSRLTRESIDLLKANFKDDLTQDEWKTVVKLKKVFDII